MLMRVFLLLCACLLIGGAVTAQDPSPTRTMPIQPIPIFAGPGITYRQVDVVRAGAPLEIIERNRIGNWVHVNRLSIDGVVLGEGWVLSGVLDLSDDLRFSTIAVSELPDNQPENVANATLSALYTPPVIPEVSAAMRDLYRRGLDMGNFSDVITKVGDSLSADPLYLQPMSRPNPQLGAYDYLADTILYFGASVAANSIAARVGLNSYAVVDPSWSDFEVCEQGETPLACEYRLKMPSVAFIMFGPNDVRHMTAVEFEQQMRTIVEETVQRGIIPVLSTFSYDPNGGLWLQALDFNQRVIRIAADYEVPLINLWAAARALPQFGLDGDGIHMRQWGTTNLKFTDGHDAFSGANLRNLLALRMLDEIRLTVMIDPNAAG